MNYPLLNVFWTIFEVFLWVIWFWILITVFIDIFRSRDLSGWGKALWFLFVLLIPLIGVLVYLIVRGSSMHERQAQECSSRMRKRAGISSRQRRRHRPARPTSSRSWLTSATAESSQLRNSNVRRRRYSPDQALRVTAARAEHPRSYLASRLRSAPFLPGHTAGVALAG